MAAAYPEDQSNHEECTYTRELKSKTETEEETATYGAQNAPSEQIFADVVEERRKGKLEKLVYPGFLCSIDMRIARKEDVKFLLS